MKYFGIPVRKNGTDEMGTIGVVSGEYQSCQNFIRYNRKHFDSDTLYAVYYKTSQNWRFQGFHSNLPFDIHMERAIKALEADPRR